MGWRTFAVALAVTVLLAAPGLVLGIWDCSLQPEARLVPWTDTVRYASAALALASAAWSIASLARRRPPTPATFLHLSAAVLLALAVLAVDFPLFSDALVEQRGQTYVFANPLVGARVTYQGTFVLHRIRADSLPMADH